MIDGTYRERIALGKLLEELSDPRFMLVDRGACDECPTYRKNGKRRHISDKRGRVSGSRVQLAKVKHQILEYLEGV